MKEVSFVMLKPDGIQLNISELIENLFIEKGISVIARKTFSPTAYQVRQMYRMLHDHEALESCVDFLTGNKCEGWIIFGEDAIETAQKIIGVTELGDRKPFGLRAKFAASHIQNVIHKADNLTEAKEHVSLFMSEYMELFENTNH